MQFKIYFQGKVYLYSLHLKSIQFSDFESYLKSFLEKRISINEN